MNSACLLPPLRYTSKTAKSGETMLDCPHDDQSTLRFSFSPSGTPPRRWGDQRVHCDAGLAGRQPLNNVFPLTSPQVHLQEGREQGGQCVRHQRPINSALLFLLSPSGTLPRRPRAGGPMCTPSTTNQQCIIISLISLRYTSKKAESRGTNVYAINDPSTVHYYLSFSPSGTPPRRPRPGRPTCTPSCWTGQRMTG